MASIKNPKPLAFTDMEANKTNNYLKEKMHYCIT